MQQNDDQWHCLCIFMPTQTASKSALLDSFFEEFKTNPPAFLKLVHMADYLDCNSPDPLDLYVSTFT